MKLQSAALRSSYSEIRQLFKNGDIVFFSKGKKNLVRRAITWFTGGPFYHVGIAFWIELDHGEKRLMLAEAQPDGFRIINLRFYNDRDMTVFSCPVDWAIIREAVTGAAGGVQYSLADLAMVGLHERFGTPISQRFKSSGGVCSTIVADMLKTGGFANLEVIVSPQRLHDQFLENNFKPYMVSHN